MSWVQTTASVDSDQIETGTWAVSLQLDFAQSHIMDPRDSIAIGINGDLTRTPDAWLQSFMIAADEAPDVNGTASIDCAPCPDPALASIQPVVTFSRGSQNPAVVLNYDAVTNVALTQGDYSLSGADVVTQD
jgi:hypothetical protein